MPTGPPERSSESTAHSRVSVVLCTYNGTHFLRKQLHSLIGQTLLPCELIVCDDASSDGTVTLLEDFRQQAPFAVHLFVNRENVGSTRNFEQAMNRASGEFLALCDQDDIWMPDKLATLVHALQQDPQAGGIFSDALLFEPPLLDEMLDEPAVGTADHGAGTSSSTSASGKTLWQLHGFGHRKQQQFARGQAAALLLKHDVVTGATLMVRADLRACWTPIPASWVHDGWMAWMLVLHSRLIPLPLPLIRYRVHAQQQLGIGGATRRERAARMRQTERARYARVAGQFEDLRQRVCQRQPGMAALDRALRQKITLLRERSQLPHGKFARAWFILTHAPGYWKYARGWRSMRKDLLLS